MSKDKMKLNKTKMILHTVLILFFVIGICQSIQTNQKVSSAKQTKTEKTRAAYNKKAINKLYKFGMKAYKKKKTIKVTYTWYLINYKGIWNKINPSASNCVCDQFVDMIKKERPLTYKFDICTMLAGCAFKEKKRTKKNCSITFQVTIPGKKKDFREQVERELHDEKNIKILKKTTKGMSYKNKAWTIATLLANDTSYPWDDFDIWFSSTEIDKAKVFEKYASFLGIKKVGLVWDDMGRDLKFDSKTTVKMPRNALNFIVVNKKKYYFRINAVNNFNKEYDRLHKNPERYDGKGISEDDSFYEDAYLLRSMARSGKASKLKRTDYCMLTKKQVINSYKLSSYYNLGYWKEKYFKPPMVFTYTLPSYKKWRGEILYLFSLS